MSKETKDEIEITPAMIEAGVVYLRSSGALEYPCFATSGLVSGLLESALAARGKVLVNGDC